MKIPNVAGRNIEMKDSRRDEGNSEVSASRKLNGAATPQNRHETGKAVVPGGEVHRWKPGQSGNPGGRPKTGALARACRAVLEQLVPGDRQKRNYCQAIAERMADLALRGHLGAVGELGDRAEGRVGLSDVAKSLEPVLDDAALGPPGADSDSESSTEAEVKGEEPQSREVEPSLD
jgi:hypothetical protein